MLKKCLPLYLTTLALLTTLLFVYLNVAEADPSTNTPQQKTQSAPLTVPNDSVLPLIPEKTLGFIYCPNLIELDNRINTLRTELLPQTEAPDGPTEILSEGFESLFKNLTGLEDTRVDLSQDFAILLTGLKPPQLTLLAHLTDPEPMRQMMEARMKEGNLAAYKDITYWNDSENNRNFVLLDRTLIVSKQREICENIIDTYNGTMKAAIKNPDYVSFFTDISDDADQFAVYFDVDTAIATLDRPLEEELESIIDNLEDDDNALFFEGIFESGIPFIKQVQSANVRFQVEGTDVYVKPFLEFRSDSEYLELLKEASDELVFLDELPKRAFMNAAFQGSPKFLTETSKLWFSFFPKKTPEQRAQQDELLEQTKDFYESLADRWSFSFNLRDTSLPVFIYELKDEQRAKAYMDEMFLEKLSYTGAYLGKSIMHNRVEIKSYVFPNFKEDLPEASPETSALESSEWHWYYAFTDGQLLFTTGTSPESMQMVLDRRAGSEEKFSDHESYQKLVDSLGTDNNVFLAISPVLLLKSLLERDIDVNDTAPIQLFAGIFMTLPENYSVGLSAKARGNGIDANLFINLADFKQLGQMLQMMAQMIQMP